MKIYFLFFSILLVLASSSAAVSDTLVSTNCKALDLQPEVCGAIHAASLKEGWSLEDEKNLLLVLLGQGDKNQMHMQAERWNMNLVMDATAPENDTPYTKPCSMGGGNCIADAWIRTFTVTPSFREEGNFFINSFGKPQAGYYYELDAPGSWGRSENGTTCICDSDELENKEDDDGNCRIDYYYKDFSKARIKMNGETLGEINASNDYGEMRTGGKYPGNFQMPFFFAQPANSFMSELDISSEVHKRTFEWRGTGRCTSRCRCCNDDGDCHYCGYRDEYTCMLDDDDAVGTESKLLTHQLEETASLYQPVEDTHEITFSHKNTMPRGVITSTADDFKIQMGRGSLGKAGTKYTLNYSYIPYNILTVERAEQNATFYSHEVFADSGDESTVSFRTFPYNMKSCHITYFYPFADRYDVCTIFNKSSTTLEISTEKNNYEVNETIIVDVEFTSDDSNEAAEIIVEYGNDPQPVHTSSGGSGTAAFDAKFGGNTITAYFSGDDARSSAETAGKSVYATDKSLNYYAGLVFLGFTVYGLVYFYKRYAEVLAG